MARVGVLLFLSSATEAWQLYVGMLAMNALTAFFTPTYQASVPAVTTRAEYPRAIALSGATLELLGVLGPGVAGGLAVAFGGRSLFWVAGVTAVDRRRPRLEPAPPPGRGERGQAGRRRRRG